MECRAQRKRERVRIKSLRRYHRQLEKQRAKCRDYYRRRTPEQQQAKIERGKKWRHDAADHYRQLSAGYRWEARIKKKFGGEMPTDPVLLEMLCAVREFHSRRWKAARARKAEGK